MTTRKLILGLVSCFMLFTSAQAKAELAHPHFKDGTLILPQGKEGDVYTLDLKTLLKPGPTHEPIFSSKNAATVVPNLTVTGNLLTGTIKKRGTYNFHLTVRDNTGEGGDFDHPAQLVVLPPAPQFNTSDIDLGIQQEDSLWANDPKGDLSKYVADPSVVTEYQASGLPRWMTLDSATGKLSGTPRRKDVGNYSGITFTAIGQGGTATVTAHGTVKIQIKRPKWTADKFNLGDTDEDAPFSFDTATKVLNPEPLDLTYSIVSMTPPQWLQIGANSGTIFGTPDKEGKYEINIAFKYKIDQVEFSESAVFTLNVKHVNHKPVWLAHPLVLQNHAATKVLFTQSLAQSVSDEDLPNDKLKFTLVSGPDWAKLHPDTGVLSGTPGKSHVGLNTWKARVTDLAGASDDTEIRLIVDQSNEPPTWNNHPTVLPVNAKEDFNYSVDLNNYASDPDNDKMSFTMLSGPAWATVDASGSFIGKPGKKDVGLNKFSIRVSDKKSSPDDVTEVIVMVEKTNHKPYWVVNPIQTSIPEESAFMLDLLGYAKDDDGDKLTFSVISGPSWATVTADGIFSGTPPMSAEGVNTFVIRVADASLAADPDGQLVINVTHINHAPKWSKNPIVLADASEETPYTASIKEFATDVDLPKDKLRITKISSAPAWVQVSENGDITGTPTRADGGKTQSFQVRVMDEANAMDVTTVTIKVNKINHAPVWRQNPVVLDPAYEDTTYKFDLAIYASDPDGDMPLTFKKVGDFPAWLFVGTDGKVTGTPMGGDVGAFVAEFQVCDPAGLCANTKGQGEVIHKNHPPTIAADMPTFTVKERATLEEDLKKWIKDSDNDPVHCTLLSAKPDFVTLTDDCKMTLNPKRKDVRTYALDLKVDDGKLTAFGKLNINVVKDPRAPIWLNEPITPTPLQGRTNELFSGSVTTLAKDLDGDAINFKKKGGPAWLTVSATGTLGGTPTDSDLGANAFVLTVCNTDNLCTDGTLNVQVIPGVQKDTVAVDKAVPGAKAENLWVIDNSDHCDKTIHSLKKNIGVFFKDLDDAQIHHSGIFLSSDAKKFDGMPIKDGGGPMMMLWTDANIVNDYRKRVDLSYSDGFCNNCDSSPIWAMSRFYEHLPNLSEIYKNGYWQKSVPTDTMLVTHQLDHYKYYTKKLPDGSPYKTYTENEFARDFIALHRKEEKAYRISAIAPECPDLISSGDPQSEAPKNAYRVLVDKTQGTYFSTGCNDKMAEWLHTYAQKIIFRAYVHAKNRVKLTKTPMDVKSLKVTIGGKVMTGNTGAADDKWSYDGATNEIIIRWNLIDDGSIKPGDQIEIEYRVS